MVVKQRVGESDEDFNQRKLAQIKVMNEGRHKAKAMREVLADTVFQQDLRIKKLEEQRQKDKARLKALMGDPAALTILKKMAKTKKQEKPTPDEEEEVAPPPKPKKKKAAPPPPEESEEEEEEVQPEVLRVSSPIAAERPESPKAERGGLRVFGRHEPQRFRRGPGGSFVPY